MSGWRDKVHPRKWGEGRGRWRWRLRNGNDDWGVHPRKWGERRRESNDDGRIHPRKWEGVVGSIRGWERGEEVGERGERRESGGHGVGEWLT
jgi:hypothetical protein